jgi:hypothetical protein
MSPLSEWLLRGIREYLLGKFQMRRIQHFAIQLHAPSPRMSGKRRHKALGLIQLRFAGLKCRNGSTKC